MGKRGTIVALALLGVAVACGPEPPPEPRVLVENGGWTWFNDERAIIRGDRLYVGLEDTTGHAAVAVVALGGWDGPVRAQPLSSFEELDDHDVPALLALDDGRILAAYARHHAEPLRYWRVGTPEGDSVAWSAERRDSTADAPATYNNLFRLSGEGGRIYDFFRAINFDPTYAVSDDDGASWSEPRHLIRSGGGGRRPYVKYASDGGTRIDLLYTPAHPRQEENDVLHAYYRDGWLHRSDGSRIQPLPGMEAGSEPGETEADSVEGAAAGPMQAEAGTIVYRAETAGRAWVWDLEYGRDGAPVAAYITARDSTVGNDLRYRYARWDPQAAEWRDREIARAGTHLYDGENHYAGGITLDPSDPATVYISADVDPLTGESTPHHQIYRGRSDDDGATWTWRAITADSAADNIRPFVPRGAGDRTVVLWLRGRYTAYTDFDTDVMGVIGRGR